MPWPPTAGSARWAPASASSATPAPSTARCRCSRATMSSSGSTFASRVAGSPAARCAGLPPPTARWTMAGVLELLAEVLPAERILAGDGLDDYGHDEALG